MAEEESGQAPRQDVPTIQDTLVRATIAAIPYVGGPLEIVYSDTRARRAAKADQLMSDLLATTGEELLLRRLAENQYVEALFVNAVDAALRTGIDAKRRLLVRAVSAAVLDDAKLDESQLVTDALAQLDVPHVLALARLADEWDENQRHPTDAARWGTSELWRQLAEPIRATLIRTGAARPSRSTLVAQADPNRQEGISDFGLELIQALRSEGFGDGSV